MARTTSTSEAYLSIIECQLYPEGSPLNYDLVNSIQSSERAKAKHCEASYFYEAPPQIDFFINDFIKTLFFLCNLEYKFLSTNFTSRN